MKNYLTYVHLIGETSTFGGFAYNPRLQNGIIISLRTKTCLWFYFILFYNAVLFYLVSHRISLDSRDCDCNSEGEANNCSLFQTSRGSKIPSPLPFLSKVLLSLQAVMESNRVQAKAGQRPVLFLLKPEQDFRHFSFPNTRGLLCRWTPHIWKLS